ncbi:MAG TPA: hypothetical protein VK152_01655, partial [Paludibacter sp.]|nr:hypothetical protein [Paludibacter sp.]
PMGKELDSLADVVSFGMAPGAIVFSFLAGLDIAWWLPFAGFLIPVFSGLRLAKFNIDTRQAESFIGLPVPANAIFWGSLITSFPLFFTNNPWILFILVGLFCFLLVSEIPMFSLKFKNLGWKQNKLQYFFLLVNVALLAVFQLNAFAPIIAWYILLSVTVAVLKK